MLIINFNICLFERRGEVDTDHLRFPAQRPAGAKAEVTSPFPLLSTPRVHGLILCQGQEEAGFLTEHAGSLSSCFRITLCPKAPGLGWLLRCLQSAAVVFAPSSALSRSPCPSHCWCSILTVPSRAATLAFTSRISFPHPRLIKKQNKTKLQRNPHCGLFCIFKLDLKTVQRKCEKPSQTRWD